MLPDMHRPYCSTPPLLHAPGHTRLTQMLLKTEYPLRPSGDHKVGGNGTLGLCVYLDLEQKKRRQKREQAAAARRQQAIDLALAEVRYCCVAGGLPRGQPVLNTQTYLGPRRGRHEALGRVVRTAECSSFVKSLGNRTHFLLRSD